MQSITRATYSFGFLDIVTYWAKTRTKLNNFLANISFITKYKYRRSIPPTRSHSRLAKLGQLLFFQCESFFEVFEAQFGYWGICLWQLGAEPLPLPQPLACPSVSLVWLPSQGWCWRRNFPFHSNSIFRPKFQTWKWIVSERNLSFFSRFCFLSQDQKVPSLGRSATFFFTNTYFYVFEIF